MEKGIIDSWRAGGTVYWRVVGTRANRTTATSEVCSIIIEAAQPVEGQTISPTSRTSLPTLSWENNCNTKFKVWFGSDEHFSKKKAFPSISKILMTMKGNLRKALTSRSMDGDQEIGGRYEWINHLLVCGIVGWVEKI